jgi:Carboxypeptidase regulatory-like domain
MLTARRPQCCLSSPLMLPIVKFFTATTASNGQFRIADLPAGTYEVSVPQLGFRTERYVQPNVTVEAGKALTLNIALLPNNFGIVGDDAGFIHMLNKYANIKGPAPRTRDGKPDFARMRLANVDPNPEPAQMLPWAVEEWNRRRAANLAGMPTSRCLATDSTQTLPVFYKIVQTPSLLIHLFEQDPHYRQAFLDGREHPKDSDPTWMGHTIGRWEKDTLVLDTVGLNDKSWLLQTENARFANRETALMMPIVPVRLLSVWAHNPKGRRPTGNRTGMAGGERRRHQATGDGPVGLVRSRTPGLPTERVTSGSS